jgi:hypothetical protein
VEQFRLVDSGYQLLPPNDPLTAFAGGLRVRLADIW